MASEASWHTGSAGGGSDDFAADQPMDQRTVETLLRRLVERVEDSERRYGQALDQLHARLDQLSQTTEAVRDTSSPEEADTFDRLHTQVSNLARRLERDSSSPLDDFERLGKALSGGLHQNVEDTPADPFGYTPEPSPFAQAAMAGETPAPNAAPEAGFPEFGYADHEPTHPIPPAEAFGGSGSQASDLDTRLVEIAQQLEQSIGTAMPTAAIEALNTRLDEIGAQLSQTREKAPTREALEHVERQISDISQQVNRAEEQLGKIAGIETHLIKLIERLDETSSTPRSDPAQLEEIANKAATEAARLVADEAKQGAERLDALHRDLTAMDDKSRKRGNRLVSTLEAVHESLKQLAQQIERGSPAMQSKPRAPFLERPRQTEAKATPAKAPMPQAQPAEPPKDKAPAQAPAKSNEDAQPAPKETLRDRLGAAIPDFETAETPPPPFGRAKRSSPDEEAVDLDSTPPPKRRARTGTPLGAGPSPSVVSGPASSPSQGEAGLAKEKEGADDLVAAARLAAQAAALRAEERGGRRSSKHLAGSMSDTEQPTRRKRSVLVIAAAVLLALSAALLYGRLMTKPEAPTTEQTTPTPADATDGATTAPASGEGTTPAADPEKSGSWAPLPNTGGDSTGSATDSANGQARTGFTDIAKSGRAPAMPANELTPEPQLASLQPAGQAAFPPGVTFSIEDPAFGAKAAPQGFVMPAKLPMPPEALGPLPLRQAASQGNANAQFAIAIRYADGKGVARDLKEAAWWLEHAAKAGLARAQYRLAAMYERGLGVDKNLDRARSLYAAAAEKGNIKAMHNLAVSVSGRDGGAPDYALAAKWYGQAAAYGLADSQFNLGILAEHGLGTPKNLADAYQWFSLAAAGGDSEAAKRREVIRVQLAPATLAKAEAAVRGWKAKDALAKANEVTEQPGWAAAAPATRNAALVTRAQTLLNKLGYDVGPPDGLVGNRTRTAIKLFQRRNGLGETGKVSIPLVTKLESLSS